MRIYYRTYLIIAMLTLVLFASDTLSAQQSFSVNSKKAIELYKKARHTSNENDKIILLTEAINTKKKFVEAYWELSRVYARQNDINKAIAILDQIDDDKFAERTETQFVKAELYYITGNYQLAINQLKNIDLISQYNYRRRVPALKEKCEVALKLQQSPVDFHPVNMKKVNTIYDDYFPSITADGKMISTTVLLPVLNYNNKVIRHQEDLHVSFLLEDGSWSYSEPLPAPVNSIEGNEGSQSFSADGRYMFFVRCGDHHDSFGSCDIYYAIRQGNRWSNPINLGEPANSRYWESNPVMSPTGDMIYFTTARPGGAGRRDIWTVQVKIDNNGLLLPYNAQPLSDSINTPNDEFAPFIHADNQTLYFASNGHDGLGNHDIFMSRRTDNGWSSPVNLGYPINTHGDESGFVIDGTGTKAYFASDKIEDNGQGLDIYEFDLPQKVQPNPMTFNPGRVFDANTLKPLQARVEIFDQTTNKKYFESLSDKVLGDFTAVLPADGVYGLSVQKDNYLFYTTSIDNPGDSILIALQPIIQGSITRLQNLFFDTDSDKILESSSAEIHRLYEFLIKNSKIKIEIVGHTDNQGSDNYNLDLSNRRANALMQALIEKGINPNRMTAKGMGSTAPVATNDTEAGRAQNRRVEVVIK